MRPVAVCLALLSSAMALSATASGAAVAQPAPTAKMMWLSGEPSLGQQFSVMRRLKVDVVQTTLNWSVVSTARPAHATRPDDPAYRWSAELDRVVALARRNHMRVAVMLVRTPAWANGGRSPVTAPDQPSDFGHFSRAAARRYPSVHLWMVWGEPTAASKFQPLTPQQNVNQRSLTPGQAKGPQTYARLVDAAYAALKAQSAGNLVVGGMSYSTGDIRPYNWLRALRLPDGRPPRMDLYGHNPFTARRPDLRNAPSSQGVVDFSDLQRFGAAVQAQIGTPRHRRVRLFISEMTLPTRPDSEFNFFVSPLTQASWITSAFAVARKIHAYAFGWVHLYDDPAPSSSGTPSSAGGLLFSNGRPKPGFAAFQRG